MVLLKWSDAMEGPIVKLYGLLCGGLYKKYHGSIVHWLGSYPDAKINLFTWSRKDNDLVVPGDQYNKKSKNWQIPFHNGQFRDQDLKKIRITE